MMKRFVYYLCAVLSMLALLVAGCGQSQAEKEITSYMEENNIKGEIFASTTVKDDAGYVGWIRLKDGKSAGIVIDKKNNQEAYITPNMYVNDFKKDFNESLFKPITYPGLQSDANLNVTVYNDQVDETSSCGEWFGKHHVFPIYASYSYDNKNGIGVDTVITWNKKGKEVSESTKLNLAKMFLEALPEFYEPIFDVSIEEGQEKYVTASVREELAPFLKEKRIEGTIIAHTPETKDGYVAWLRTQNAKGGFDSAVVIDKKNNQKALINIDDISSLFGSIENSYEYSGTPIFLVMIYNDTVGADRDLGKWYGSDHLFPAYAPYDYDREKKEVIPGRLFSANGIRASHYQAFISEQQHIELINMFLKSLPVLYEPVTGKALK